MLKTRVIPTLLWKDVGLVKGIGFDSWRRVGSVLPAIKVFNTRQVDELIVVDINANENNNGPDFEMVAEIAHECFVPLTIGGGITNCDQIKKLLRLGADKISINTAAFSNPELITEAANKFGTQCVIASIDVVKGPDKKFYCYSHSGKTPTSFEVVEWAKEMEKRGAGEILLTDVKLDGTMQGYNLDLIKEVSEAVSIPVIASGGAGKPEDFYAAVKCGASAVAAASLFQFTELTPMEIKSFLATQGVPVRSSLIMY
jgi:imidazole glycerol-phosphate synthase subunit HisF